MYQSTLPTQTERSHQSRLSFIERVRQWREQRDRILLKELTEAEIKQLTR